MNLKSKITNLEERLKCHDKQEIVAITAHSEAEFEEKMASYLQIHREPKLFVFVKEFSEADCWS